MAYEADFTYDQGTTFTKYWIVYNDPSLTVLANIAGYNALMEVRYSYDSSQILFTGNTAQTNMSINTTSSTVQVNIANTDFNNISFPANENADSIDLVYDVVITSANLASYRIAQGTMTVNRAITR